MSVVRCARRAAGLVAMLGWCGAVAAMQPPALFNFDLDRMPLHDALQQYSSVTGRSVIYDSSGISGLYSPALRGAYTADDGLRWMIAGSGMEIRHATPKAVSLVFAPPEQTGRYAIVPSSAARSPRARYYGSLQAQLRRLLCADPAIEAGSYRMVLRFRIAPKPPSVDVLHVVATGRPELESRIRSVLQGQPLGEPPPGFGQPVTLLLTPEGMRRDGGCAS
ncbi:STN domain-containing protein [Achromobacter deleyi]|uniref:STN domain-containing protein n=1 Tax=Achromobacter deleyi TaxID=1353891 RepID=UPI001490EA9C|nr:STN domain-containing protein [Achromobacter deleyi]QVQ28573.1 STN domain-containing protein [Achromobacter deleyi]UIP18685.1 STN domain-containing protein [Achromobacter deleyi]